VLGHLRESQQLITVLVTARDGRGMLELALEFFVALNRLQVLSTNGTLRGRLSPLCQNFGQAFVTKAGGTLSTTGGIFEKFETNGTEEALQVLFGLFGLCRVFWFDELLLRVGEDSTRERWDIDGIG
jgi:hypothetical protein